MNRKVLGLILILIGSAILFESLDIYIISDFFNIIDIEYNWPFVLIVFGMIFFYRLFKDTKDYELIFPAVNFTVYGIVFLLLTHSNYSITIWPYFILGPAFALWLMQFSPHRKKDHLISATVLTFLGLYFLAYKELANIEIESFFGVLILIVGVIMIFRKKN